MAVLKKLPGETSGYPLRPWQLDYLFDLLGRGRVLAYGSYWPELIVWDDTAGAGDIDLMMSLADFRKLPVEVRREFRVSPKCHVHRLKLLRDFSQGRNDVERPYVLETRGDSTLRKKIGKPVGLTLVHTLMPPELEVKTMDLGFRQLVDDGEYLYTTDLFHHDIKYHRITVARLTSLQDFGRSMKRAGRFLEGAYREWTVRVPRDVWSKLKVDTMDYPIF